MKRISLLILTALLVLTLTACGADPLYNSTSATEEATAAQTAPAVEKDNYDDSFDGMQKYLIDMNLLPRDEKNRTEIYAEVVGAESGVRYTLSSSAFIEFYEYTDKSGEAAKSVLDQINKDGSFEIVGLDPLTAVLSDSGKYMIAYNSNLPYDGYANIIAAFSQW